MIVALSKYPIRSLFIATDSRSREYKILYHWGECFGISVFYHHQERFISRPVQATQNPNAVSKVAAIVLSMPYFTFVSFYNVPRGPDRAADGQEVLCAQLTKLNIPFDGCRFRYTNLTGCLADRKISAPPIQ